jgi:hypothetical protein
MKFSMAVWKHFFKSSFAVEQNKLERSSQVFYGLTECFTSEVNDELTVSHLMAKHVG